MFVDIASKLPCDTPDDVLAISGSLAGITSNPKVVSSNGQVLYRCVGCADSGRDGGEMELYIALSHYLLFKR